MDIHIPVREWAERLQYKKKIPSSFNKICNHPSFRLHWQRLIDTVKPKQQIQHIRNNIIISRLKQRPDKSEFSYRLPINEIKLWKRREELKKQIDEYDAKKEESKYLYNDLCIKVNLKYSQVETTKMETEEIILKTFMYEQKINNLIKETTLSNELRSFFNTITSDEENQDEESVTNTLKQCSDEVLKLLERENRPQFDCTAIICKTPKRLCNSTFDSALKHPKAALTKSQLLTDLKYINDENLSALILKILNENSCLTIWSSFFKLIATLKLDLSKSKKEEVKKIDNKKILNKLRALIIENQLLCCKYDAEANNLKSSLADEQSSMLNQIEVCQLNHENLKKFFLLKKREVGLKALCEYLEKAKADFQTISTAGIELKLARNENLKLQNKLIQAFLNLDNKAELFRNVYNSTFNERENCLNNFKKLLIYTEDMQWATLLQDKLINKEIEVFADFPLEYNKNRTGKDYTFYRGFDSETFIMVSAIIESPCKPAEIILIELVKFFNKMNLLRKNQTSQKLPAMIKYDIEELEKQESYTENILGLLEGLIKKYNHTTNLSKSQIKDIMKFWMDMPVKDFILSQTVINNENLNYYQNLYNSAYDSLK